MLKTLTLISMILLGFLATEAQTSVRDEAAGMHLARRKSIEKELSRDGNPDWAGEYTRLGGVFLILALESGFASASITDTLQFWVNYGSVEIRDGKLVLAPQLEDKEVAYPISRVFYPVIWGDRHYLIPESEVIDFANAVNIGYEPGSGLAGTGHLFFLKREDEKKVPRSKPLLPAGYSDYLLEKPIRGKITYISSTETTKDKYPRRITHVQVNVGKDQGVKVGMEFVVYSPRRVSADLKIINVGERTSGGVIEQSYIPDLPPSVGWKISTTLKDIK